MFKLLKRLGRGPTLWAIFSVILAAAPGCRSNSSDVQKGPVPVAPAIAPGTVRLTVTVGECQNDGAASVCDLLVDQVTRYGSATPSLPKGTSIRAVFPGRLFSDQEEQRGSTLQTDRSLDLTIFRETRRDTSDASPDWRVVTIH